MAAFDDDDDWGDLDISFGEDDSSGADTKNPKSVIFSSGVDLATGALESVTDGILGKIPDMIRATIPSEIRDEYSKIEEALSEVKEEVTKNVGEIKDLTKDISTTLSGFLPQDTKLASYLREYGKKDTVGSEDEAKSKEQQEQEKVNAAILEALGNANQQEANTTMVKEALDSQRHANSQEVLKNMYGEMKVLSTISHKYYIKSLELQYKHLYKTSELVEVTRTAWEANRRQLEAVLTNTSLPDTIKLMALQDAKDPRLIARSKDSFIGKYFKDHNPFAQLQKNVVGNIRGQFDAIKSGLGSFLDVTGNLQDMNDTMQSMEESGFGKSYMLGTMVGEWFRDRTLGKVGERLAKTKLGRKTIFNTKNFVMDPRGWLEDQANNPDNGKGIFGKWKQKGFDYLRGLTGNPTKESVTFEQEDLDSAKAFDGRAHQALVKVIPGLLTKIHSAITKNKDEDKELIWDNKLNKLTTRGELKKSIGNDVRDAIQTNGFRDAMEELIGLYTQEGVSFKPAEKKKLGQAVASYLMNNQTGRVDGQTLVSKSFMDHLKKFKLDTLLGPAATSMIQKAQAGDYSIISKIGSTLSRLRSNLPSINDRLTDLHKSGHLDIAGSLGLAHQDRVTGRWSQDTDANDAMILKEIGAINYSREYNPDRDYDPNLATRLRDSVNDTVGGLRETGRRVLGRVADSIPGVRQARAFMGTRSGQRIAGLGRRLTSPFSWAYRNTVGRAREAASSQFDSLIHAMDSENAEEETAKWFTDKRVSISTLVSPERLRSMPSGAVKKLKSSFKSAQSVAKKTTNEFYKKARNVSISSVREAYQKGKEEIDKLTKDFVHDCRISGVDVDKINEYKRRVKEIQKDTMRKAKDKTGLLGRFVPGSVKSLAGGAMKLVNNPLTRFGARRVKGVGMAGINKVKGFFSKHENTTVGDVIDGAVDGSKRAAENIKRRKEEAQRQNGWGNKLKAFFSKAKDPNDKDKKGSRFGFGKTVKMLGAGGLAFGALMLLKNMGVTLEDVGRFAKSTFNTLRDIGSVIGSIASVIGAPFKFVGWIGDKIGSWLGKGEKDENGNHIPGSAVSTADVAGKGFIAASLYAGYSKFKYGTSLLGGYARFAWKCISAPAKFLWAGIKKLIPNAAKETVKKLGTSPHARRRAKIIIGRILKQLAKRGVSLAVAGLVTGPIAPFVQAGLLLGFVLHDAYKIYNLWKEGRSFFGAMSEYYLGINFIDDDTIELQPTPEDAEAIELAERAEQKATEEKIEHKQNEETINKLSKTTNGSTDIYSGDGYIAAHDTDTGAYSITEQRSNGSISTTTGIGFNTSMINQTSTRKAPPKPDPNYIPPRAFVFEDIGSVSGWFESKNNPGCVSSGRGDAGGRSYGVWQMASNVGTVQEFVKISKFKEYFNGLLVNTPEFISMWKQVAAAYPKEFRKDQFEFIKKSHYDPIISKLKKKGWDFSNRSDALKATLFSCGVHYGAGGAVRTISKAIVGFNLTPESTDEEIINAIYDQRIINVDNGGFRSSSLEVQQSVRDRFTNERNLVLSLLMNRKYTPPIKARKEDLIKKQDKSTNVDTSTTTEIPKGIEEFKEEEAALDRAVKVSLKDTSASLSNAITHNRALTKSVDRVNTSNIKNATGVEDLMKRQLAVQTQMLSELTKIVVNTNVLSKIGNLQKDQQNVSPQQLEGPTVMPSPVVNLERQERFNI